MSRRYDTRTTTFSPAGRLFQVEYAMEAISNGAACVGVLAEDGVVIATQKVVVSKLLAPPKSSEKIYKIDEHVFCAVAGLTSDANILIDLARRVAQNHRYTYGKEAPVEAIVTRVCDIKQGQTQFGGLRPYGVSFLFGGWDKHHKFQLYHSDPSGNFGGWKATAIGSNFQSAQSSLKSEYKDGMDTDGALELAVKVLMKTIDSASPTAENMELATLTVKDGAVVQTILPADKVNALVKTILEGEATSGDV